MANLVCGATGNFTAAGTWNLVDHALVSTNNGNTALTTSNQDSATFVPTANALVGVVLRLSSRATGAPSNTIIITLRNSTTATDITSVTANVSDLPAATAGADSEGGWHYFKFSASHTPNGTDSYVIRARLSATTTAVSLSQNGTAANWQRLLVRSTTQAPAAGDDLYMAQTLDGATNPATVTSRTITMDSTAATDYGTAVVSTYQMAVSVSKACIFAYGVAASTNYILRISGSLGIYSGGIMRIGSSGAEIPRNSTAVLEFDNASDGQFGYRVMNGGTLHAYGLSRSSGKEIWKTLLSADVAAAATTINVVDDTGWLNGDEVILASTTRTSGQTEVRSLNANAGASSFTISAGLTNAHSGSGDYIGEVVLLTRNVEIRSVSTTNMMYANHLASSIVFFSWMRFRYYSSASGGGFWTISTTSSGSFTAQKCVFRDADRGINTSGSTHGGWTVDQCVIYNTAAESAMNIVVTSGAWTLTDVMFIVASLLTLADIGGTIGNLWFISCTNGIDWSETKNNAGTNGPTFPVNTTWTMHSSGGGVGGRCLGFTDDIQGITFPTFSFWRNSSDIIELDLGFSMVDVEFSGNFFGNGVSGTEEAGCFMATRSNPIADVRFRNCNISGDTLYQANWGILFDGNNVVASEIYWETCVFSENTGTRRPFLVADIGCIPDIESGGMFLQGIAENCTFGAPESVKFYYATGPAPHLASKYSYVLCPRYSQNNALHRTYTAYGTIIIDTTTFVSTPSQNIKPIAGAALSVDSNAFRRNTGFMVAVASGATCTPSVSVEIDASYNGSTNPQLVVLKNRAAGINADTVLATHSGATGSFEVLSAATAAVAADCVLEFVVRCYGTAGNVWVDSWSTLVAGQDTTGVKYWFGQPVTNANSSSGGGGGGETSTAYIG